MGNTEKKSVLTAVTVKTHTKSEPRKNHKHCTSVPAPSQQERIVVYKMQGGNMAELERNDALAESFDGLIEIAPDIYKMSFPKHLDWVGAFFYKGAAFYNANFTGKQCETITRSLHEIEQARFVEETQHERTN